jgi:DNA modification methylase
MLLRLTIIGEIMIKPYHETEHGVLYHGSASEVLKSLPDNSIDMILTSPPYDNLRTYNGFVFDFESIAKELFRVLKKGGVCVWIVGDATINGSETGTSFKQALYFKEIGFNLHDTMIYEKAGNAVSGSLYAYPQVFEYMFVFSKDMCKQVNHIKDVLNPNAGKERNVVKTRSDKTGYKTEKRTIICELYSKRGNVWKYNTGFTNDSDSMGHPATFPEQLAIDHVISWSNEGDTILDCFMGSGTTAKACIRMKRKYIGIDISEEYVKLAAKRIETTLDQTEIEL